MCTLPHPRICFFSCVSFVELNGVTDRVVTARSDGGRDMLGSFSVGPRHVHSCEWQWVWTSVGHHVPLNCSLFSVFEHLRPSGTSFCMGMLPASVLLVLWAYFLCRASGTPGRTAHPMNRALPSPTVGRKIPAQVHLCVMYACRFGRHLLLAASSSIH